MTDTDDHNVPRGSMILRTLAMPGDTNPNGDIFGGWVLAQMDIAGGILAKELARGRVVTIGVDSMKFIRPVKVGDVVCCYGELIRTGSTSITLHLETWVKKVLSEQPEHRFMVTKAEFTYVAIDEHGKKRLLPGQK
ncbi:MAG: acyl-CoA thioester hydrolase YciA [Thiothrix sp.]|nr:acyl-CoA thioester hydrolase YciA [Thiothrix sp.]HPE60582.1 acyl-CoA thioester hydrolase YciA [Thiolinea sp.]